MHLTAITLVIFSVIIYFMTVVFVAAQYTAAMPGSNLMHGAGCSYVSY
jgi:hypothetical protein